MTGLTPLLNTPWLWLSDLLGLASRVQETREGEITDDDHSCMRRMAAGDPDAMQPLFERWKLRLMSYFYRSLGSQADAEDLTLASFTRLYRTAARYRPEASFSAWLFAIARNELLHELRRRRRKPVEAVAPEELGLLHTDASEQERRRLADLEEELLTALARLPEEQRSLILLAADNELSHGEIATALGIKASHFTVKLHRARKALLNLFKPSQDNE